MEGYNIFDKFRYGKNPASMENVPSTIRSFDKWYSPCIQIKTSSVSLQVWHIMIVYKDKLQSPQSYFLKDTVSVKGSKLLENINKKMG